MSAARAEKSSGSIVIDIMAEQKSQRSARSERSIDELEAEYRRLLGGDDGEDAIR